MLGKDEFYQAASTQGPGASKSSKNKKKKKKAAAQPAVPQRYIPGLNSANDENVIIPLNKATKKQAAREVPPELVEEFLDGKKNPISALTEYGALQKLIIAFEECAVERPSIVARYATLVRVNGKPLPQGTGATKKDAKTAAAKRAFSILLGLESEDVENAEDRGKLIVDAYGRKMIVEKDDFDDETMSMASSTASSKLSLLKDQSFKPQIDLPTVDEVGMRPLWDQPKNPVSSLTEYCSSNDFDLSWNVSDRPTDMGFKAAVSINDDVVAFCYALNKKEAKKQAALKALEIFCGGHNDGNQDGKQTVKPSKPNPRPSHEAEAINSAPKVGGAPLNMPTYRGVAAGQNEAPKDYIEMLQDICRLHSIAMELVVTDNPGANGLYEAYVSIHTQKQVISVAEADTKKDAKRMAARDAWEQLSRVEALRKPVSGSMSTYDSIASLCHLKFKELLQETGDNVNLHKYLSAFVLKNNAADQGTVVAIGTGNGVISSQNRTPDGRALNDCHSVVIARRALMKYFHREIRFCLEGQSQSIFERIPGSSVLQLKDGATVHLYMSRAPCGDAVTYNHDTDGRLSPEMAAVMEALKHEASYPSDNSGFTASKTGVYFDVSEASEQAPANSSMSCSDKVMKWNTVGLQGSLFSQYIKPIYISSVTIGSMYNHGHLTRALCCRLTADIAEFLPAGFRVNHADIGRVTTCDPSHAQSVPNKESINWSLGDGKIEIIDTATGRAAPRSPFMTGTNGASRLAKAGFLFRFRDLARLSNRKDLFSITNYRNAKDASIEYQQANATVKEHLEVTGFGYWATRESSREQFTQ